MAEPKSRSKILVIRPNYLQGPVEESKIFSKAPGYYYWVLVIFISIYLFIYCPTREGCSVDVLQIFRGLSVHVCDFNKVAKRLLLRLRSALCFSCEFASCLWNIFLIYSFSSILFNKIYFWGF